MDDKGKPSDSARSLTTGAGVGAIAISKDGTKLLLYVPYTEEPKNTLISEWLGLCIEGINEYAQFDNYRAALTKFDYELTRKSLNSRYIISYYSKTE